MFKKTCHCLFIAAATGGCASSLAAEPPPSKPMTCEAGPATKTFGNGPWLIYACDDGQSVVVVSGPGNPAFPFYFMFSASAGEYRLVGEGTGSKQASGVALAQLKSLSAPEVAALGMEARRIQSGSQR